MQARTTVQRTLCFEYITPAYEGQKRTVKALKPSPCHAEQALRAAGETPSAPAQRTPRRAQPQPPRT